MHAHHHVPIYLCMCVWTCVCVCVHAWVDAIMCACVCHKDKCCTEIAQVNIPGSEIHPVLTVTSWSYQRLNSAIYLTSLLSEFVFTAHMYIETGTVQYNNVSLHKFTRSLSRLHNPSLGLGQLRYMLYKLSMYMLYKLSMYMLYKLSMSVGNVHWSHVFNMNLAWFMDMKLFLFF